MPPNARIGVTVQLTPEEFEQVEKAAEKSGQNRHKFMHGAIMDKARQSQSSAQKGESHD